MTAYTGAYARRGQRERRARSGAVRVFCAMLLLLFLAGVVLGVRLGRSELFEVLSGGVSGLFSRAEAAQEVFTPAEPVSNIPESIELPSYITEELLTVNPYSRPGEYLERVNAVVIHYVGNPGTGAEANRSYFEGLATSGETSASSNLIVGLEGETLLCVPLGEIAYCSNRRNSDTISIEYCHPDDTGKPSDDTYASLVRVTAWLCGLFGLDPETDVIRHYDVIGKECPRYYVQNEEAWLQFKLDVAAAMK